MVVVVDLPVAVVEVPEAVVLVVEALVLVYGQRQWCSWWWPTMSP